MTILNRSNELFYNFSKEEMNDTINPMVTAYISYLERKIAVNQRSKNFGTNRIKTKIKYLKEEIKILKEFIKS